MAWMLLLGLHGLFGWMLTRIARIETSPHADADAAMQVVYVESIARDARRERRELSIAPGRPRSPAARIERAPPVAAAPPAAKADEAQPRSLSARFIEQARQSIAHREGARIASPDPLASRKSALPGAGGGRFRMRVQRSPADIVQAVGTYLFAPPGYDPDPCPRNRANIDALITQGDSPALQRELDFERRHCRS